LRLDLERMEPTQRTRIAADLTPRFPPGQTWVPHVPHPPQQAFLLLSFISEVFYGGAAGGGKSDAGLMGALQYADVPGYSALIIRRDFQQLALPGAIMQRAEEWLTGQRGARKRDGGKRWEFDTADPRKPATLQFGYAAAHADVYRYQGAEFQYVFFDELTHFEERTYRYLFSRLRGPSAPCANCTHETSQPAGKPRQHDEDHDHCACGHEHLPTERCDVFDGDGDCGCSDYRPVGCPCLEAVPDTEAVDDLGKPLFVPAADGLTLPDVPLRMRSGSNPGGLGHDWVKARFVDQETREEASVFVPAKLRDNPSLDRKAYREGLGFLTATERARLEDGDWEAGDDGDLFLRGNWKFIDADEVPRDCRWVRRWDMAATVPKTQKKRDDPDFTAGCLMGIDSHGRIYIGDMQRWRKGPLEAELTIKSIAETDGRRIPVRMEQEPGASGVSLIDHYKRGVLLGWDFDGNKPVLSKEERARPLAKQQASQNVWLVSGPWNRAFVDEAAAFPTEGVHDDQVDAASGAFEDLTMVKRARIIA
jgi:predicted phage terminase large subunit-like protein